MPVPRRRNSSGMRNLASLPAMGLRLLDIDFIFQKTRTALLWGFAPMVVTIGMMTEPRPASWFELINIFA